MHKCFTKGCKNLICSRNRLLEMLCGHYICINCALEISNREGTKKWFINDYHLNSNSLDENILFNGSEGHQIK
jgi:hypothetical protein